MSSNIVIGNELNDVIWKTGFYPLLPPAEQPFIFSFLLGIINVILYVNKAVLVAQTNLIQWIREF